MQKGIRTAIFLLVVAAQVGCGSTPAGNQSNNATTPPAVSPTPATDIELQKQISEIAKDANGKVGVYAVLIETGETVSLNAGERYAMQSVVKLPISMAVMSQVNAGKLTLDQKVKIAKNDFVPSNMRSPIRDSNQNGVDLTVEELLRAAISESDGTAADVLQRVAGGAKGVQTYIDSFGIGEMTVKHTHKEFGQKWELQYENWATPMGTFNLLMPFFVKPGPIRIGNGMDLIRKFMTESNNPAGRIVAGLPKGTVVAHKTGTGGTRDGITSATNDVGIITLPNGDHIAIVVFVGDSSADLATREAVIARITKAIWDRWNRPKSSENTSGVTQANFSERHSLY